MLIEQSLDQQNDAVEHQSNEGGIVGTPRQTTAVSPITGAHYVSTVRLVPDLVEQDRQNFAELASQVQIQVLGQVHGKGCDGQQNGEFFTKI